MLPFWPGKSKKKIITVAEFVNKPDFMDLLL